MADRPIPFSINGSGAWLSNPWVCVTSWSHVIHQNIDNI